MCQALGQVLGMYTKQQQVGTARSALWGTKVIFFFGASNSTSAATASRAG